MLEDPREAAKRHENQNGSSSEGAHIPFNCEIGLSTVFHAFAVGYEPSSADDRHFTPPYGLGDGEDRPIDIGLGIPVSRDQKHVRSNEYTGLMDAEGSRSPVVPALHIDETYVCGRFVQGDVRIEPYHPSAGPQRPKKITFHKSPGLSLREPLNHGERKVLRRHTN